MVALYISDAIVRNFLHSSLPLLTYLRTRQFQLKYVPPCMNVCSKTALSEARRQITVHFSKEKATSAASYEYCHKRRQIMETVFHVYVHVCIVPMYMHIDRETIRL